MHKLAEIQLLDIAELVWDGSDCLVEMMTVEFYIDSKGPVPCWDNDRVEFYIDSKGLQLKESLSPSPSSFCC